MDQPSKPVGVAVIGLGFMGQTHLAAYRRADELGDHCRVVAVCDADKKRLSGRIKTSGNIDAGTNDVLFDPAQTHTTTKPQEIFENRDVDLVSIATHTDSHADLAIAALKAGKHVLIEKPVARTADEVRRVLDIAQQTDRIAMPAMCIRFWPAWSWLKVQVEQNTFGPMRSAAFHRRASPPAWATDFYRDETRSGAALVDLHIHDSDFIRHLIGDPDSVVCTGSVDHLTTIYRFSNGPEHVVAHGGWDYAKGFDFQMGYLINFEKATVEYHSGRDPEIKIYRDGDHEGVHPEAGTGYEHEIQHIVNCIRHGNARPAVTLDDALATANLLDTERASLRSRKEVTL